MSSSSSSEQEKGTVQDNTGDTTAVDDKNVQQSSLSSRRGVAPLNVSASHNHANNVINTALAQVTPSTTTSTVSTFSFPSPYMTTVPPQQFVPISRRGTTTPVGPLSPHWPPPPYIQQQQEPQAPLSRQSFPNVGMSLQPHYPYPFQPPPQQQHGPWDVDYTITSNVASLETTLAIARRAALERQGSSSSAGAAAVVDDRTSASPCVASAGNEGKFVTRSGRESIEMESTKATTQRMKQPTADMTEATTCTANENASLLESAIETADEPNKELLPTAMNEALLEPNETLQRLSNATTDDTAAVMMMMTPTRKHVQEQSATTTTMTPSQLSSGKKRKQRTPMPPLSVEVQGMELLPAKDSPIRKRRKNKNEK